MSVKEVALLIEFLVGITLKSESLGSALIVTSELVVISAALWKRDKSNTMER